MDKKVKILIIEDQPEIKVVLEKLFHFPNINYHFIDPGYDTLSDILTDQFALAILNIRNNENNGIEIFHAIRSETSQKKLPLLLISGNFPQDNNVRQEVESGLVDIIFRPIVSEIIIGKVKAAIEKCELSRKFAILRNEKEFTDSELNDTKQKSEQANYTKSMFLANMSHEIRTPLNGILGMANILAETNLTKEQRSFLHLIQISGENLLLIINDILDFSKIETGQISLEETPFNLTAEIETVMSLMRLNAQDKHLDLKYYIDKHVKLNVIGDPLRLRQILINLINNAIKFTETGGVILEVIPTKDFENQQFLKFSVVDTGIGINYESKNKLFKEFSQADNSITRKFGGTGLGLAICKSLINLMGGKIGLESELGKGSVFWFEIPYQESLIETSVQKSSSELDYSHHLNILVAEDNPINQKVVIHSLSQLGYHCDLAKNGRQAVDLHLNKQYDVIFMDIQMPELDGLEATISIRNYEKNNNQTKPVIIVAATANAFNEDKQKCLNAGMNFHMSKPFRPEELKKMLVKVSQMANSIKNA
jgi:signal transduction histidine kinase